MAKILVVDDNTVVQRTLGHTLRKIEHQVTFASNGQEALDQLAQTQVDLIICDLAMPVMDGLDFLRHLRASETLRHVSIIMLTSSGQDEDRITARAQGANEFLTKPTSSHELIDTVNRVLGSH